jgi:hypothetical protein
MQRVLLKPDTTDREMVDVYIPRVPAKRLGYIKLCSMHVDFVADIFGSGVADALIDADELVAEIQAWPAHYQEYAA